MRAGADEWEASGSAVQAQQRLRGTGGLLRANNECLGDTDLHCNTDSAQGNFARGAANAHHRSAQNHGPVALSGHAGAYRSLLVNRQRHHDSSKLFLVQTWRVARMVSLVT